LKKFSFKCKKAIFKIKHKPRAGFTLIELIVAIAISTIILGAITSIFVLTYKSYDSNTSQADAQNLAALTIEKIQTEVRASNIVYMCKDSSDISGLPFNDDDYTYTPIYYDATNSGIDIGGNTYLAGTFKNYVCNLTFSSHTGRLLDLYVNITNSSGATIYQTSTSIYLTQDGAQISGLSGNAIDCAYAKNN
jgi:prepilin-type N-terminal cleavage/methylation domain-containing protein